MIGSSSGLVIAWANHRLSAPGGREAVLLLARANVAALVSALAGPLALAAGFAIGLGGRVGLLAALPILALSEWISWRERPDRGSAGGRCRRHQDRQAPTFVLAMVARARRRDRHRVLDRVLVLVASGHQDRGRYSPGHYDSGGVPRRHDRCSCCAGRRNRGGRRSLSSYAGWLLCRRNRRRWRVAGPDTHPRRHGAVRRWAGRRAPLSHRHRDRLGRRADRTVGGGRPRHARNGNRDPRRTVRPVTHGPASRIGGGLAHEIAILSVGGIVLAVGRPSSMVGTRVRVS